MAKDAELIVKPDPHENLKHRQAKARGSLFLAEIHSFKK